MQIRYRNAPHPLPPENNPLRRKRPPPENNPPKGTTRPVEKAPQRPLAEEGGGRGRPFSRKGAGLKEAEKRRPCPKAASGVFIPTGGIYSAKEWMTMPERSFGSNQVVLGGMMLPVSAMLMSCCIETG